MSSDSPETQPRPALASAVAAVLFLGALIWASLLDRSEIFNALTLVLLAAAIGSELFDARWEREVHVSGSFAALMFGVAFLGPEPAFVIIVVTEIFVWIVTRFRWRALIINLAGATLPILTAGVVFESLVADFSEGDARWTLALAGVSIGTLASNFLIVSPLMALLDGRPVIQSLRMPRQLLPALGLTVALTVAAASMYAELGIAASVFTVFVVAAFAYMTHLLTVARERAREYADLSWGVLSGLIRTLDERDKRAARHCAAVAKFARDIAEHTGMNKRDQEVAHTAGLLHDIGRFALSDRVMERGAQLSDEDWQGIRKHPELGAALLRDIGVYGPIADIIRAHHERLDGRGYPGKLKGDEIPPIARIIAVAEVYDTLTAPDTYRTPMNSFEALTELRRVSGTQLDPQYVEALSELLAGRGTEYRHADEADYDRELDIERRINEAAAP